MIAPARRQAGFTLLEVAIAMAILGIGVVTVIELFGMGLRMAQRSGIRARAVIHARTLLDQTMTMPELAPGSDKGRYDEEFRWERSVREARELTEQVDEVEDPSDLTLFEIEVSVLWPQGADREGVYTMRTLRVGPPPF